MVAKKGNGFGVAAFVLGLIALISGIIFPVSIITGILAIVFFVVQRKRAPSGLATAGLVMGILGLLAGILILVFFLIGIVAMPDLSNFNAQHSVVQVRNEATYLYTDDNIYENTIGGSGIVMGNDAGKIKIATNRHVLDCVYTRDCQRMLGMNISIMAYDGKIFWIDKIYVYPHEMDLAVLEFDSTSFDYPVANISTEFQEGDSVIAIGYPAFSITSREFSIESGTISNIRELIAEDGYKFNVLDSNAYTNFGSSGGGLFDEDENLIGITTWIDSNSISYAISAQDLVDQSSFVECDNDSYYNKRGCIPFCPEGILTKDYKCLPSYY